MFATACQRLGRAVVPIIPIWRTTDGHVFNGVGAGIVVNGDGWVVTCGHMVELINQIQTGEAPAVRVKRTRGRRSKTSKPKVQNFDVLYGASSGMRTVRGVINPAIDVGALQVEGLDLTGFDPPVLRSGPIHPGELLCRIGFPFTEKNLSASWDAKNGQFQINGTYPPTAFVNEALVSRFANVRDKQNRKVGTLIETSSPGLKGQSGGPLADANGAVCAVQVSTAHYPLGFEHEGRGQVLNVGRAVHVQDICALLKGQGIQFTTEEDQ